MAIKLNLINRSSDVNNSDYVVFQENADTDVKVQTIAWKVVHNLGNGDNHPFVYSDGLKVSAKDANGNYMPQIKATPGSTYGVVMENSGHKLCQSTIPACTKTQTEVWNNLSKGSVDMQIYRDDRLLATKVNVPPGSKANFEFLPKLFIGVVSQVEEGDVMNSNVTVQYLQEISLLGITSADIVVTGGGAGVDATPFMFSLENVV